MKAVVIIDSATPALEALANQIEDKDRLYRQWMRRMLHKIDNDITDKHGQSQFWHKRVAGSVETSLFGGRASLFTSNPEAIHKQFGGLIYPKTVKMLAIPLDSEVKKSGDWPRDRAKDRKLFKVEVSGGRALLGFKTDDGEFKALWLLVPRVEQRAEPWWPTEEDAIEIALKTLDDLIQTE